MIYDKAHYEYATWLTHKICEIRVTSAISEIQQPQNKVILNTVNCFIKAIWHKYSIQNTRV